MQTTDVYSQDFAKDLRRQKLTIRFIDNKFALVRKHGSLYEIIHVAAKLMDLYNTVKTGENHA